MQNKQSRSPALSALGDVVRQARQAKGWSQRELSARTHMPQAQISRIENADVDPQVSTLIELARTLELELQLIPKSALTAVEATVRSTEARSDERASQNLMSELLRAAEQAHAMAPDREDIASLLSSLRDLQPLTPALRARALIGDLKSVQILLHGFLTYPPAERPSHAQPIRDAAQKLKDLRNMLVHAPAGERPAYSLDDED
jgi:transcriptional regulator with XRE-family HTH domain